MKEVETKSKKQTSIITWGPLAAILVIIGVYLSTQIAGYIIIVVAGSFKHMTSTQASNWFTNSIPAQFWITVAIEALSLLLIGMFLKYRHSNFFSIGINRRPRFKDLGYSLIGLAGYLTTYYAAFFVIALAIPSFANSSNKQDIGFSNPSGHIDIIMVFISLVLLPPIVEEIMFRGFLYSGLRTKLPKLSAAVITSVIFCLFHLIEGSSGLLWTAALDTFILSMFLVLLREKTHSLYASMGLHMLKNFLAFATIYLFHFS